MRILLALWMLVVISWSSELKIIAAANLKFVLEVIKEEFLKDYPDASIQLTYLSSGKAYAQIKNGLDVDVFFSADLQKPQRLFQEGFGLFEPKIYALGKLVVCTAQEINISTDSVFLFSSVKHISIANPKLAPYGEAAEIFLKNKKIYEKVRDKLVIGDSIGQAFLHTKSGGAEIGINALSLVIADPKMSYRILDTSLYPKIEQALIILKKTKNEALARAFTRFVMSEKGQRIFERFGYGRDE
ncbi:molybdate ABC transporter substrate-binding protein [Helicobacter pametensis]|uniref:molybdate ABC transporter substrate-binding protein n=1 Tax=Helicobacter pametensis TaxID=95149 RepID=UPI0004B3A6B8|nr:molybdate ABC transporter substrate-binding protein [Helicobacter pametensis]